MWKKWISAVLAVIMLMALLVSGTVAESAEQPAPEAAPAQEDAAEASASPAQLPAGTPSIMLVLNTGEDNESETIKILATAANQAYGVDTMYFVNDEKSYSFDNGYRKVATGDAKLAKSFTPTVEEALSAINAPTIVWVMMPARTDFSKAPVNTQLLKLLDNPNIYVQLMVVGTTAPADQAFVQSMVQTGASRVQVTYVSSDRRQDAEATGEIHSLTWTIASIFGRGTAVQVEHANNTPVTIAAGAEGTVLILAESDKLGSNVLQLKNGQSKIDPKYVMELNLRKGNNKVKYVLCRYDRVPQGSYTLVYSGKNGDVDFKMENISVFLFPDLSALTPELAIADTWYHEEQDIVVRMETAPEIAARTTVSVNVNAVAREGRTLPARSQRVTYADGVWKVSGYDAVQIDYAQIIATVTLTSLRGDAVWSTSVMGERTVQNMALTAKESTPEQIVLYTNIYTDANRAIQGRVVCDWHDFFSFNDNDDVRFYVNGQELYAQNNVNINGVVWKLEDKGFTLTTLSDEAAGSDVTISVMIGRDTKSVSCKIVCMDVSELYASFESGAVVQEAPVGGIVTVKVQLSEENRRHWEAARAQNPELVPELDSLVLSFEGGIVPFTEQDGLLTATTQGGIPTGLADGYSMKMEYQVNSDRGLLATIAVDVKVTNSVPTVIEGVKAIEGVQSIVMNGGGSSVEAHQHVLTEAFGTDVMAQIFEDAETPGAFTVCIKPSRPGAVTVQQGETAIEADEQGCFRVTDLQTPVNVSLVVDGETTIEIWAEDDSPEANEKHSEVLTVSYKTITKGTIMQVYVPIGAGILLVVLLAIVLLVRKAKPSFKSGYDVYCYTSSEQPDVESSGLEMLHKAATLVQLDRFGKNPITLTSLLINARQMPLTDEGLKLTDGVELSPDKSHGLRVRFSDEAYREMEPEKRTVKWEPNEPQILNAQGTYIYIEIKR